MSEITPYKRRDAEPYLPGNYESVKSGVNSPRIVAEKVVEIQGMLQDRFPILADPLFTTSLERCCNAQARACLLGDYVSKMVSEGGVANVKPYLWTELARAEANAQKFAQDCGLDPIGFAKLAKELGWAKQLSQEKVSMLGGKGKDLREGRI